jgi:hypothetical protein
MVEKATNGTTHLVMASVSRSAKSLVAIPRVQFIVSSDWITQSVKAKRLLRKLSLCLGFVHVTYIRLAESDFPLQDKEKKYGGLTGAEILLRRDALKPNAVFTELQLYVTKGVNEEIDAKLLSEVIKLNGGKVHSPLCLLRHNL